MKRPLIILINILLSIATTTNAQEKEKSLGIKFSGWTGKYFESLDTTRVDFPIWMIHSLDKEAQRLGVPRQSIIKLWIAEKLEKVAS